MENARDKWKNFALAFGLLSVVSAATGASAYIMKDVINEIFVEQRSEMIWVIAGAVVLIYSAKGIASYWNAIILARTGNAIVARLQRRMYARLLEQDMTFLSRNQLGDLLVDVPGRGAGCQRGDQHADPVDRARPVLADLARRRHGHAGSVDVGRLAADRPAGGARRHVPDAHGQGRGQERVQVVRRADDAGQGDRARLSRHQELPARGADAPRHGRNRRGGRAARQQHGAARRADRADDGDARRLRRRDRRRLWRLAGDRHGAGSGRVLLLHNGAAARL